jgi:hypothetical protein
MFEQKINGWWRSLSCIIYHMHAWKNEKSGMTVWCSLKKNIIFEYFYNDAESRMF